MRDVLILAILAVCAAAALFHPWIGIMGWTVVSIMNPHRYSWAASDLPVAAAIVVATVVGMVLTRDRVRFFVSPVIAQVWQNQVERLSNQPGFAESFLPNGRAPRAGEHFRCPGQAATLETIARTRGEDFYRGGLAQKIVAAAGVSNSAMAGVL